MSQNVDAINEYVGSIKKQLASGHAKEHAYRPALERLMSSFENVVAVNDPKRSAHGNPDFIFLKQSNQSIILGYAEAKDIDISLDKTETTDQMKRYGGYENLYLSNYIEFRFFQNGNKYKTVSIGSLQNGQLSLHPENYSQLADELTQFLELPPESIKNGKRLAQIMGAKARRIRDNVAIYLNHEDNEMNQELEKIYGLMRELLVHDLSQDKFADMYAQTLVYGLFVARYGDSSPETFNRSEARDLVPASNPFLREFFDHIVGPRFDKRLGYIVDELCEVFSVSDVHSLVQKHLRLFEVDNEKDPIIHFYEDFLKEYDPLERKKMGAYYTQIPVVDFIVKQVDEILKRDFDLPKGLADTSKRPVVVQTQGIKHKIDMHRVQILDPAVGTATFLNQTIKFIHSTFIGQEGRWTSYAKQDLLPRLHGFELMMAPYTIAHLKLGMTLQETGVKDLSQRLGVYLTNTLDEGIKHQQDLFSIGLAEVVTQESHKAAEIKHERPIMVIIGNPPYAVESSNKTTYANSLIDKYRYEPGGVQKLQERNSKVIGDDYVKFISFAESMIEKNGSGIVAMITNHGYLDNPTFRGMRWHLARTFDKIYVLDLHGNSKKQEVAPDGSKDENVFDIMQGVSIIFALKTSKSKSAKAKVFEANLFGKRKKKFEALSENKVDWKEIKLDEEFYLFKGRNLDGQKKYNEGVSLTDLFIQNTAGFKTSRDSFVIDINKSKLQKRIAEFADETIPDEDIKNKYGLKENAGWTVKAARQSIGNFNQEKVIKISYRPFDDRWTYWDPSVNSRMREKFMSNLLQPNVCLATCRQQSTFDFQHVMIYSHPIDMCSVSLQTRETGYAFPLYLYHDDGTKSPNFVPTEIKRLMTNVQSYSPEEVMDYIYAILHSPKYRKDNKVFLKLDFPKIPAPKNETEFQRLAKHGSQLRELHLMISTSIEKYETTFPKDGSNIVDSVTYESAADDSGKVIINNEQYFGNIPKVAWNQFIGGYQPAQKWLKDRKGMTINNDDIEHYQKMIAVLIETERVMKLIDNVQ